MTDVEPRPLIVAGPTGPVCTCTAFPEPHTPGLIEGQVYCEQWAYSARELRQRAAQEGTP